RRRQGAAGDPAAQPARHPDPRHAGLQPDLGGVLRRRGLRRAAARRRLDPRPRRAAGRPRAGRPLATRPFAAGAGPMTPTLIVDGVTVRYGETVALQRASFEVAPSELHVLLGASGCGKTTLLRAIAGFEKCTEGRIELAGAPVDAPADAPERRAHVPPEKRNVGIVFQDYALFPHL